MNFCPSAMPLAMIVLASACASAQSSSGASSPTVPDAGYKGSPTVAIYADGAITIRIRKCTWLDSHTAVLCTTGVTVSGSDWDFTCSPAAPFAVDDMGRQWQSGDYRYGGQPAHCPQHLVQDLETETSFRFNNVSRDAKVFRRISHAADPVSSRSDPAPETHEFRDIPIEE